MTAAGDLGQRVIDHVPDVEHLADRFRRSRCQQCVDDVVDVHAIAALRAIAEDVDLFAEQALADEDGRKPNSSLVNRWRGPYTLVSRRLVVGMA